MRVKVLRGRPRTCFRCLCRGHEQERCPPSQTNRRRSCHYCGGKHLRAACKARKPHCPECELRGKQADHTIGGLQCPPIPPSRALTRKSAAPPPTEEEADKRGDVESVVDAASAAKGTSEEATKRPRVASPPGPASWKLARKRPKSEGASVEDLAAAHARVGMVVRSSSLRTRAAKRIPEVPGED